MSADGLRTGCITGGPLGLFAPLSLLLEHELVALACDLGGGWLVQARPETSEHGPQEAGGVHDPVRPDESGLAGVLVDDLGEVMPAPAGAVHMLRNHVDKWAEVAAVVQRSHSN